MHKARKSNYLFMVLAALVLLVARSAAANSIEIPDAEGVVGWYTSLALDTSGNPVVSYYDDSNGDLKVLHCNDPDCAGGDESITSPDTAGDVGEHTSLALDGDGYPVISYYDRSNSQLKVMHCNDANCAGGDESITTPDAAGNVGETISLALDGDDYPVVATFDGGNGDLKIIHCNDADCAGGDESISVVDAAGTTGYNPSLALDASGYPVVSYHDISNTGLKVLHCNDANCVGGDESITGPDGAGDTGVFNALALDANGYPVIAYHERTPVNQGLLKLMHCNDANCAGDDESVVAVDTDGRPGWDLSLVLDGGGNPVLSYYETTGMDLRFLACNDPDCAGDDDAVKRPDIDGDTGIFTSLALDAGGYAVVSYGYYLETEDSETGELRILHCDNASCNTAPLVDAGADLTAVAGEPLTFAGSASDQDGDSLAINWDFGDGNGASGSLMPTHTYDVAGEYTVTLAVDDGDGGVVQDTLVVTVEAREHFVYLPVVLKP